MRCARVASPITADSSCLLTPPPTLIFHHRNPSSLLAKTRAHIQDAYTHYILTHTHLSCFFLLIINLFAPPTPYTPHQGLLRTLPSPTPQSTVFFFVFVLFYHPLWDNYCLALFWFTPRTSSPPPRSSPHFFESHFPIPNAVFPLIN